MNMATGEDRKQIDQYPALFTTPDGTDYGDPLPLIVVGAVNRHGQELYASQGRDLLTVAALGEEIHCPWRYGPDKINESYGEDNDEKPMGTSQGKTFF